VSAARTTGEEVRKAALEVMERAYAPYSGFRVGAALRGTDGSVYRGCNVENAAYPVGMCAERSALAAAVAAGARDFNLLVIATEGEEPASPCGFCRQALSEFSGGGTLEVVSVTVNERVARWQLAELLPHPFGPGALGADAEAATGR
jgi:cytidine deaminase